MDPDQTAPGGLFQENAPGGGAGGGGGGSPELFLKVTTQETKIILRYHQRNRISNILPHQGIRNYFSIIIKTEVSV